MQIQTLMMVIARVTAPKHAITVNRNVKLSFPTYLFFNKVPDFVIANFFFIRIDLFDTLRQVNTQTYVSARLRQ